MHRVRPSRLGNGPFGRPATLYSFPEVFDTRNYLCAVSSVEVEACREECEFQDGHPCDPDVYELCCLLVAENSWSIPDDVYKKVDLYIKLRNSMLACQLL